MAADDGGSEGSLESRPGVLLIGSPNVGKRTLLSRLLSIDFPDTSDLSSGVLCQGWTIETKYYSADVSIWTTHLDKGFSFGTLPFSMQLVALVMVFDLSDESSFTALQDWVAGIDTKKFEILLCIGNKADIVPGHYGHAEYRRHLQKRGESFSDPHPEYFNYGILETETCSLLGDDEPSLEIKKSCMEWCSQHNIEYVEASASNAVFDKCLSVDGDIQGVERLYGALSAYMWPGMILKSGNMIATPSLAENEETSDEDSDYEIEYEVLSRGSDESWDYTGDSGVSFKEPLVGGIKEGYADELQFRNSQGPNPKVIDSGAKSGISTSEVAAGASSSNDAALAGGAEKSPNAKNTAVRDQDQQQKGDAVAYQASASEAYEVEVLGEDIGVEDGANATELDEEAPVGFEDLQRLMCEISSTRDSLRLMPDFQRREMAAKLAMKMAAMFGESDDGDGGLNEREL